MRHIRKLLLILIFFINPVCVVCLSFLCFWLRLIDKTGRRARQLIRKALKMHSFLTGMHVDITYPDNIFGSEPYLILANFNNISDIFAVLLSDPGLDIVCILRAHNFYLPFIGIVFKACRFISFNSKKIIRFIQDSASTLQSGSSVLHFPAGYSDLSRSDFVYSNFLAIRKKAQVPILPVTILQNESSDGLNIRIIYHHPIMGEYSDDELKSLVVGVIKAPLSNRACK